MNYKINTEFEDGTTVRFETSNRKLFFRIEQIINDFQFTNEEPNRLELKDKFQSELDLNDGIEKTQNNGNEERGIELDKTRGNEENQNKSQKNRGNELQNTPKVSKRRTKLYPPINTKYGRAYFDKGYYRIRDKTSPYNMKTLHRLIFEEHHRCTLLPHAIIHHIDGDKTNQDISNLQLMSNSEHTILHNQIYGFTTPERTLEHNISISKSQNKSGYFRVSIAKANNKQGFVYRYQYYENGQQKSIRSKNLRKLEKKVKAIGQPWRKL